MLSAIARTVPELPKARSQPRRWNAACNRLELQSRRQARALDALGRQAAVAEEALAQRHAAHLQALELERLVSARR